MTRTASLEKSLAGRTLIWKFVDGPTAGSAYEHRFHEDGSVEFAAVGAAKRGPAKREERWASFEIAPEVHLASYLADNGYTLTVATNFRDGKIHGFASNGKEWHPVTGTVEVVS